jgi:hypothetical protein
MKRFTLIITLLATLALSASAGDYDYLTVQKSDGVEQSFTALGVKITFSGSNMVVTQNGTSTTFALSDLGKMYFSAEPTGIEVVETAADKVQNTAVYDLQGRKVADAYRNAQLPKGIYIINGRKVAVK